MNNVFECRTCKKCSIGFCVSFVLCLIFSIVAIACSDISNLGVSMFFSGGLFILAMISLIMFLVCKQKVAEYIEKMSNYYVYSEDMDSLVERYGFHDECNRYERTCVYCGCVWVLRIDATTGKITASIVGDDHVFENDLKFAIKDLMRYDMVYTVKPIV